MFSRLNITIPTDMAVALDHLAQKNGIAVSAQARMILKQGLSRTMDSLDFKHKLKVAGVPSSDQETQPTSTAPADTDE